MYLRRQILCLQSTVVFASAQSRSKSPNSNLPLPGKQVDLSSIIDGSGEATGNEHTGSGSIFVRDSGVRIEPESLLHWIPAGVDLSSRSSPSPSLQHLYLRRRRHSSDSLALLRIFASLQHTSQSRLPTCCSEDHPRSSFFPSTLVLVLLCSRFWCQNRCRILHPIHSTWRRKYLVDFGGAAEAFGANPPDDFTLFTFTGQVDTPLLTFSEQKFVQARFLPDEAFTTFQLRVTETGLQPVEVLGELDESFTPAPEVGTGRLYGFSGAARKHRSSIQSTRPPSSPSRAMLQRARPIPWSRLDLSSDLHLESKSLQLQKRSRHCSPSLAIFKSVLLLLHMLQLVDSLDSPAQPKRRSSIIQSALHFTSSMEQQKRAHLLQKKELQLLVWMSMAIWSREQPSRTRVQVRSSDSPAPPKRESIVPRGLRNIFTVVGNVEESETNVEIGSGTLSGFVGGAESTSNAEVKFTLFTIGGDTVGGDVKFTAANLAVGQVRIGLSNDGIPGDGSRGITIFSLRTFPEGPRSDLLEQKQSPSLQHHISLKVSSILRRELRILSPDILNIETHNLLEL